MIRIVIYRRSEDSHIAGFRLSGHAHYDVPGKDLVCAGVSAVAVGAVNAVETLTGLEPDTKAESGLLVMHVPETPDEKVAEKLQHIMQTMEQMLLTIEESYGDFVRITNSRPE